MRTRRWGTWFFGCAMALLPLMAWLFAHSLTGGRGLIAPSATPELLFFALSTSSTGLLSLAEDRHPRHSGLWAIGLVITVLSAVFYGEILIGETLHAARVVRYAYYVSLWFAGSAFIYGAAIEEITCRRFAQ